MNKEIRDFMEEKLEEYCSDISSNGKCDNCIFRNRNCNFQEITDEELEHYYKIAYPENNQKENDSKSIEEIINQLEKEKQEIEKKLSKLYAKEKFDVIDSYRDYVGKCYIHKLRNEYYKVISNYSSSKFHITCLCFNFDEYSYNYGFKQLTDFITDYPYVDIDTDVFYIKEENCNDSYLGNSFLNYVEEISEEEYEKAMDKKIKQFKQQTFELPFEIENMVDDYKKG